MNKIMNDFILLILLSSQILLKWSLIMMMKNINKLTNYKIQEKSHEL